MVKHSVLLLDPFFMREPVGKPQYIALTLLLIFLAQCSWLVSRNLRAGTLETQEWYRLDQGGRLLHAAPPRTAADPADPATQAVPTAPSRIHENRGIDPDHSALWYLLPAAPLMLWPGPLTSESMPVWGWLIRGPYLFFGVMLGASLWYVARRLYGNVGGFIALTLYCFAPGIIRSTAVWYAEPEIGAAWGAFGAIFTGIAVAHTLYAPREVVLWNWRRILLLGVSIALAIGSQYSLFVIVLVALSFMLYLAPERRQAAIAIWLAACLVAGILLLAAYGFHPGQFFEAARRAYWFELTIRAFTLPGALGRLLAQLGANSPALLLLLPVAVTAYAAWPRARYFGNTAPLLVACLCLVLGWASPHYPGLGFQLVALPFFFVFVAGVFADLLETRQRVLVLASLFGLLSAYAVLSLWRLVQVTSLP
jgi:hypothetical protein